MGIGIRALVITSVLAVALYFTYGQFSLAWMTTLTVTFSLAVFALPTPRWYAKSSSLIGLIVTLLFLALSAVSLLPDEPLRSVIIDVARQDLLPWMRGLFVLSGVLIVALYVASSSSSSSLRSQRWSILIFAGVLLTLTIAYALIIPTSPSPQIDVWTIHEQAADAFAHFQNPYTIEYINIYPENLRPALTPFGVTLPYLPGVFMWMAPFKALGLDTRYSQVFAHLLTALLLVLIARRVSPRRGFSSYLPALVFFTFPMTTFFIVRGWNDDLSVLFFALAAYALCSRRASLLFVACNGLLLLKQYAIFCVPLLIWYVVRHWRRGWIESTFKATFAAVSVAVIFAILDWRNFLGSLYGFHFLKHPKEYHVFPDRTDSFSLMNFLRLYTGLKSASFFAFVVLLIALRMILKSREKSQSSLNVASLLRGLAAIAFAMVIFSPISFANYYEYAIGLLLVAFAADPGDETPVIDWEFSANWWMVSFVAVRSVLLFMTNLLIIETRPMEAAARLVTAGQIPYIDFQFRHSPFALVPGVLPVWLVALGDRPEFLSYHTLFQLIIGLCDVGLAVVVFKRWRRNQVSKGSLALYVFGPLLLAPIFYVSSVLATAAATLAFFGLISKSRLAGRLTIWIQARKKAVFFISLSLVVLCMALVGLLWALDFEIDLDSFLFPTHLLMWVLVALPFAGRQLFSRSRRPLVWSVGLSFTLTLALTGFLLFNIETVLTPGSELSNFIWIRNSLLGFSAIIGVWTFYRSRIAPSEV